jgi:hypothetical protein
MLLLGVQGQPERDWRLVNRGLEVIDTRFLTIPLRPEGATTRGATNFSRSCVTKLKVLGILALHPNSFRVL